MTDAPQEPIAASGIELAPGVLVPEAAIRLQYARSGGPGGQNVNKLNTKAELWISLEELPMLTGAALQRLRRLAGRRLTREGQIHLSASAQRSQEQNRAAVMQRLREMLIRAMAEPRARKRTRPSRAAQQRRLESKRRRGEIKSQRQKPLQP